MHVSRTQGGSARWADATPHAAALIESLRDIGYSFETALSDIIDNSITAGASYARILTDTASDDPFIAIVDDGKGMTEKELIAAMRPGSTNPLAMRGKPDLGRFGLGLKSASFSQCRRLTVVSRKANRISVAIWDLDDVAQRNDWTVQLRDDISGIPVADQLDSTGTLVVWQKLDRLIGGHERNATNQTKTANRHIAEAERHLRLVFHRFMEGARQFRMSLNGRTISPIDPFARNSPATIADPVESLNLAHSYVLIQSFTLPHQRQMKKADWEDLGGPEGHLKSQGFYLYRGERLILYGTWFGLCRQSELTKLSRVCIDIPNSMDSDWKIDVKKSSAQLPAVVRDRLKQVIERIQSGSKRTYRHRGQKLVNQERLPIWQRVQANGEIRYHPDTNHPAFAAFAQKLDPGLRQEFINCIAFTGASLPIETLYADMAAFADQIVPDQLDQNALIQTVEATISMLTAAGKDAAEIQSLMKDVDPFRSTWPETQRIITAKLDEAKQR